MTASCTSDPSCLSPEPCSGTTVADLVAAALVPPCLDEDEIFSAVAPASQPVRVCPASRMQDDEFRSFPWTQTPEPRVLPSFARTPDKVADLERNSASQSTGARTNDGVAGSKTPSTKSRRAVCPQLALSDALLRPRTAQLPTASVLDSSVVRQKRLCRRGPDGTAQRFEKEKSHLHAQAGTEMPEDPDSQTGLAQQALVTTRPGTCTPLRVPAHPAPHRRRKKLEVESDYTQATESWMARIPSDETLQDRREQRNRIVVANRITSRETVRAAFKGKSLLEERWIGNLDDSVADTELSIPSIISWLRRTDLYANTALTHVQVLNFVQQILAGHEVNAVCNVAGRRSKTISAIQFQAIIRWIAQHKGITYSECITKLVHHPNERTRLEHYFEDFAHATSYGYMTVYEFTRFCRAYGLFKLRPGRFVEGDVQFLFCKGGEGKAVDLEGFRRVLEQVADRVGLPAQELLHFLGEKDAERIFREGMDSAGLRRKAVVAK